MKYLTCTKISREETKPYMKQQIYLLYYKYQNELESIWLFIGSYTINFLTLSAKLSNAWTKKHENKIL